MLKLLKKITIVGVFCTLVMVILAQVSAQGGMYVEELNANQFLAPNYNTNVGLEFGVGVAATDTEMAVITKGEYSNSPFKGLYYYTKSANTWSLVQHLPFPAALGGNDLVGYKVALADDWIFVNVTRLNPAADLVLIYRRVNGLWEFSQHLNYPPKSFQDRGLSFDYDAGTLVIGAPDDDTAAVNGGALYIYTLQNNLWMLNTSFTFNQANRQLGWHVEIDDQMIILSGRPDVASLSDRVQVAVYNNNVWSLAPALVFGNNVHILQGSDRSFSWDNGQLLVSTNGQVIRVYQYQNGNWLNQGTVNDANGNPVEGHLASAIFNNYALVSTLTRQEATLIERSNGVWQAERVFDFTPVSDLDSFEKLTLNSTQLIWASETDMWSRYNAGRVVLYDLSTSLVQQQLAPIVPPLVPAADSGARFGNEVEVEGNYAFIYSDYASNGSTLPGMLYIYERNGATWLPKQQIPMHRVFFQGDQLTHTLKPFTVIGDSLFISQGFNSQLQHYRLINGVFEYQGGFTMNPTNLPLAKSNFWLETEGTRLAVRFEVALDPFTKSFAINTFQWNGTQLTFENTLNIPMFVFSYSDYYQTRFSLSFDTIFVTVPETNLPNGTLDVKHYRYQNGQWMLQGNLSSATGQTLKVKQIEAQGDQIVLNVEHFNNQTYLGTQLLNYVYSGGNWVESAPLPAQGFFPNVNSSPDAYLLKVNQGRVLFVASDPTLNPQVQIYQFNGNSWTVRMSLPINNYVSGDFDPYTGDLSGDDAVIGLPFHDVIDLSWAGAAYVYKLETLSEPTLTNTPTVVETFTNTPIPPTLTPTWTPSPTLTHTYTPIPPTETHTNTPIPTETSTPTPLPPTLTPSWTPSPTLTHTYTPIPPTETLTHTPIPPTETHTHTPIPPTATQTHTPQPQSVELLRNRSFEDDLNPNDGLADFWGIRNGTGERRICDASLARTGSCAFEFRGSGATEDSILQQRADLTGITFNVGDVLTLRGYARSGGAPNFRVRIVVNYADGTSQTAQMRYNTPSATYAELIDPTTTQPLRLTLTGSNVVQIRVIVWSRNTTGRAYFDDFSLIHTAPSASGLIPMP